MQLSARVGIHTGAVVRGGGVEADNSLSGLAVHIAARMEQTATPGGLRISQDTWALVRGLFEAQAQEPITVKGHDAPIASWLVKAALPRERQLPGRGIAGQETPLVGRDLELERFEATVQALAADGQPRSLTLLADAGLGKSRLLREFQHALHGRAAPWRVLPARAQPSGALQPYGLLRDLLLRHFDIADSDSAERARNTFVQGLAPWLGEPGDPAPELPGQLIGLDFADAPAVRRLGGDARLLVDRALAALRLWLQRLAARDGAPVVLLLDDLHWADEASLDALPRLLQPLQAPVLALMGARPALLERRPDRGAGLPRHESMVLQPLDAAAGRALTQALLQRLGEVPEALAALIEQRAAGNPFYAEELVLLLIDQGAIERQADPAGAGEWVFHAERMQPERLPTTLTAVLQARIDALDTPQRRALQMASVIGPVFWDEALARLDADGPAELPALQKKALVQPRPASAIEHTAEEAFQHHLLHQVSYGTVLKPERREAHARTAAWLSERVGERSDEFLAITAQHHERAGQHAQAADCYERAAQKALFRSAYKAVLQYLDSADAQLALAGDTWPPERLNASLRLRAETCDALGLFDQEADCLERVLALAVAEGRVDWVAHAMARRSLLDYRQGRLDDARTHALHGAAAAREADAPVPGALCLGNLAWMARERGELDAAQGHLDAAMPLAVQARERMAKPQDGIFEVQLLLVQAEVHGARGAIAARMAAVERALRLSTDLNHPRLQCASSLAAAEYARVCADEPRAAAHLAACERVAAEFGLSLYTAMALEERARLHLLCERWTEALQASELSIAQSLAIGYRATLTRVLHGKAEALWRAGRVGDAAAAWEETLAAQQAAGDEGGARGTRLRLADARAASADVQDLDAALQAVRAELPALAEAGALSAAPLPLAARLAAWRVLHRAGDAAAPQQLALAEAELQQVLEGFDDADVRQRVAQAVPWHREVLDALAAHGQPVGATPPRPAAPAAPGS